MVLIFFQFLLPNLSHSRFGILSSVNFHRVGLHSGGFFDLPCIGIEKQTDRNAGVMQTANCLGGANLVRNNIQPAFGRNLFATFRHKRGLIGLCLAGKSR